MGQTSAGAEELEISLRGLHVLVPEALHDLKEGHTRASPNRGPAVPQRMPGKRPHLLDVDVGRDVFQVLPGWEWFDTGRKIEDDIAVLQGNTERSPNNPRGSVDGVIRLAGAR